jgi:plastocyanin
MFARARLLAVSLAALAPLALPAAPAHALVPWQVVSHGGGFVAADFTIVQGDTVQLTNVDPADRHDITSLDTSGGIPLFGSSTITFGQSAAVTGVSFLLPSVYPYYCSVHEYMTGTITVLAA